MSTLRVSTLQNASSSTANITLDTSGNATVGGTLAMGSSFLRNRIINGDMRIDQRNAGASVNTSGIYTVDRWVMFLNGGGVFSTQRSTDVPNTSFTNSVVLTVTTPDSSIAAGDFYAFNQNVEGFNVSDLGWGTATARAITLSFWARSSISGTNTYSVAIYNADGTRGYPATYTLAANTWTYVSLTIPGPTDGVWGTGNGIGLGIRFDLGSGSSYNGTANTWSSGTGFANVRTSSSVNWIATNGATFNLTGVQLEVGSVATPFERRQYGTELMLCQRYLPTVQGNGAGATYGYTGFAFTTSSAYFVVTPIVAPRVYPTGIRATAASGFSVTDGLNNTTALSISLTTASTQQFLVNIGTAAFLTQFRPYALEVGASSQILFTGCEL